MSNPDMLEMVTATLRHRRPKIADATTKNNAFMLQLRRKGRIRLVGGGRTISCPISYGENNNFQFYSGRETLNVAGQEVLTSAEYPWKQYACGVSISGLEMLQNDGQEQIISMMKARIENAERTIANKMHESAYSDGTGSSGKEFGGLALLVASAAGATVGGINSTTATWWDNKRKSTGGAATGTIYADMLDLSLDLQRGTDKTDLIISDNTYYSVLSQSLQNQRRYMDSKIADAGFKNILFEGVPVVFDGGDGGYAPVGMQFLDLSEIEMIMHRKRNNVVLSGPRRPVTEDSDTVVLAGMGNFITGNRARHGRLQD
jgi:hypothetical protein